MIRHLLEPRIIQSTSFVFPSDTRFYWFKPSDGIEKLDRTIPYLNKTKKAMVITPTRFRSDIGVARLEENSKIAYDLLVKNEKRYNFLKPDVVDSGTKDLVIYNYGSINFCYDYKQHVEARVEKYNNVAKRMIEDLKVAGSNRLILMEVPNKLPSMDELDTFARKLATGNITKLSDYKYFNLIELWRWLTPDLKSNSFLNGIMNPKLETTSILFSSDTRMSIVNLGWLFSTIAEYTESKYVVNSESSIVEFLELIGKNTINLESIGSKVSYSAATIRQCVYIMLVQLVNGKSVDLNKIKSENEELDNIGINRLLDKYSKDKNISIQHVLDSYIVEVKEDVIDVNDDTDIGGSDLDFSKLEANEAQIAASGRQLYDSIEDLKKYKAKDDALTKATAEMDYLLENKLISKAHYKKFIAALNQQGNIINPYTGNTEIEDVLNYDLDDLDIKETDVMVNQSVILFEKAANTNTLATIKQKYLREQYRKDIIRSVYGLQQNNMVILDYKVNIREDIMGKAEEHAIEVMTLSGKKVTLRFDIPYVNEDGTFTINATTYSIRAQRTELIPRKIDALTVVLSSYYGKVFISKARALNYNVGGWFKRYLIAKQDNNNPKYDKKLTNMNIVGISTPDVNLPLLYAQIARECKGFVYSGTDFTFNYEHRYMVADLELKELEAIEGKDSVFIGKKGKTLYFMGYDNDVYEYDGKKMNPIGSIFDMLDIDTATMPIEFAGIMILKEYTPIAIPLSYYLGLENMIKMLKLTYRLESPTARVKGDNSEYVIKFQDKKLVIKRDNGIGDLILAGFLNVQKYVKDIPIAAFNDRTKFGILFGKIFKLESTVRYTNEIRLMESMFIDPMTLNVLKKTGEPENFPGLLIRAVELLSNDNYHHPNNLNEMLIKGYERIAGFIYKELVTVVKDYENKSMFSRANMIMDRYAIWNKINEDSTKVAVDDLNPVAYIKQTEDLSFLGDGGRSKDTMVKSTRELHSSEIGVVSEASKDSGSVGITAYMTASPKLENTLGIIEDNKNEELGWYNLLSTPGMLSPFGITDDPKRLNFSNIHSAHIIPIHNMVAPFVMTGYETMVPIKAGPKFAIVAKEDGVVTNVDSGSIEVEYKSGKKESYRLSKWTTKEESGSCYTHEMVANLAKGVKFLKDDTIAYDKLFFEPCIFEPRRVVYKQGTLVNMMLSEDTQTYEDSVAISQRLNDLLGTTVTKVKSIVVDKDENIINLVQIGDKVEPSTSLFTMVSTEVNADGTLDKEALEILKEIGSSSPKAKYQGVVSKIVVYYNFDPKEASRSLKKLIEYSDKVLLATKGFPGKVTSGYSIQGVPLQENTCEIKIYIDIVEKMGTGDKAVFGNQIKCTASEVFDYNLTTESGDRIDAVFSNMSLKARIVNSPDLIGTTTTLVYKIQQQALDMYFK